MIKNYNILNNKNWSVPLETGVHKRGSI